jgi:hypothetical protein
MENSAETQLIFKASLISQPTVAAQKYNSTMDKSPLRVFIASSLHCTAHSSVAEISSSLGDKFLEIDREIMGPDPRASRCDCHEPDMFV